MPLRVVADTARPQGVQPKQEQEVTANSSLAAGSKILIEGENLALSAGTGIATYARQLGGALGHLGYAPQLLVGSRRGFSRTDPMLAEISLFDHDKEHFLGRAVMAELRKLAVGPLPRRAVSLPRFSTVVPTATDRFAGFERVHAVPHLSTIEQGYFGRFRRRMRVVVDHQPDLFHATRPAALHVRGAANIYTVHDVVPFRLPFTTLDNKKLLLGIVRELCRKADHIVTVSEFSRQDIIKLTGISEDRITNTYQAVQLPDALFNRPGDEIATELEALFGLEPDGYFLFVGAIEPKKNVSRLIDAFAASGVQRPLVVAGGQGWMNKLEHEKIESERFLSYKFDGQKIRPDRSIRHLSYLPLEHLVSLIRGARAVLFPSLYEGFGLPVLESMTLGTPVMTSTASCLPEVAGEAALLVDPYSVQAMSKAIRQLDADADLRAELRARGLKRAAEFSPEAYRQRLDKLYASILGHRKASEAGS